MAKNYLTLEDLNAFFQTRNRAMHFSAKDDNDEIVVSLKATISFEETENDATEGLTPVRLKACHTLDNANHTYIPREDMTTALPSFANRPILAYIYKDSNGDYQFKSHEKHIDEDGELVYDEVPVGVIRENCNAHLEYDEEAQKEYVVVDGFIFNEYSKAKDILEREGECFVSVELAIRDFSYNAKDKLLVLNSFYFEGVTILGYREDGRRINPGMTGSNIKLADFKKKNNIEFSNENIMNKLQAIEAKLQELEHKNFERKEEQIMEGQNLENTGENNTLISENEATAPAEPAQTESAPVEPETPVEPEVPADPAVEPETAPAQETFTKSFELAHDDIRVRLYALLSEVEETNGEYYYIEHVYDSYFIYEGPSGIYKQNYSKENDTIAFVGERVHMNAEYLTDEELALVNEMRSNYPTLIEKLAQYESEPEKLKILQSRDYALIQDNEEFKKLCERDMYFSLSTDEIRSKCDAMLNAAAKALGANYEKNEQPVKKYTAKPIPAKTSVSGHGRYGLMFVKH